MCETSKVLVSVIVINWNGAPFLPRCFQSLRDQTFRDFEVILADNASTDESVYLTQRDFPEIRICSFVENLGYAEANNKAAAGSDAKYLFFLNNDTHLDANALAELVNAAETRPEVHIMAAAQRTYDGKQLIGCGNGLDILGLPVQCGKLFMASGAALFIYRDVFEALGGFDPHYFMFFDEIDLCWRAALYGYQIGTVPRSIVYHVGGGSSGEPGTTEWRARAKVSGSKVPVYATTIFRRRFNHRNQLATLIKNYSMPMLPFILSLFGMLTAAEIAVLILSGQASVVPEVYLPAWRDLWHDRPYVLEARRTVQEARIVNDWTILRRLEWKLEVVSLFLRAGVPKIS